MKSKQMKIKKLESDIDLELMEWLLSYMDHEDLNKLKYAEDYITNLELSDTDIIQIGPLDVKSFKYFIYLILSDYEIFYPRKNDG